MSAQGPTGPDQPSQPPNYTPPPAGGLEPESQAAPAAAPGGDAGEPYAGLEPGRGAPLVSGPPKSVSGPIGAGKINTGFGIFGIVGILAIIVVVILVAILLLRLLVH